MSKQSIQIETPEEKRLGNKWSWISLICFVGGFLINMGSPVLLGVLDAFFNVNNEMNEAIVTLSEVAYLICSGVSFLASIAALVIMIYVRVKYPQNVFGKVLMWVYIVLFALYIITMAVIIIACGIACGACMNDCQDLACITIERLMI